ncbi:DUF4367 domain-containing protein [Methanohalobium evestigatum]|nr:DUF4367 domain-containing protein [Methanohalobium evestigatum]
MLLVSGCTSQRSELTADQIKQTTIEKFETIDDYTYTMNITLPNNSTNYIVSEVSYKEPGKEKMTLHRYPENTDFTAVNNGSTIWIYNSEDNIATRNPSGVTSLLELNPLNYRSFIKLINNSSPELLGSETLNGKQSYIMQFKLNTQQSIIPLSKTKTWIGKENYLPVKSELYINDTLIITAFFRDFKINENVSDSVFEYTPPENAIIMEPDNTLPQTINLDEAKSKVDFNIKIPTYLPKNYEMDYIQYVPEDSSVVIYYENDRYRDILVVLQRPYMKPEKEPRIFGQENVTIGDDEGIYSNRTRTLEWNNKSVEYILQSEKLDKDELIKIAESMEITQ